jgi:hypothetical protein
MNRGGILGKATCALFFIEVPVEINKLMINNILEH